MDNLQLIKSRQQSKHDEIIEYLKQDDGYWLENDKWDLTEEFFIGKREHGNRFIHFYSVKNEVLKNQIKYYFVFNFKNKLLTDWGIARLNSSLQHLAKFLDCNSLIELNKESTQVR